MELTRHRKQNTQTQTRDDEQRIGSGLMRRGARAQRERDWRRCARERGWVVGHAVDLGVMVACDQAVKPGHMETGPYCLRTRVRD